MKRFSIVCNTEGCSNKGNELNRILVGAGLDPCRAENLSYRFQDDFDESTAKPEDYCPECHKLGALCNPETIIEIPPDPDEEFFLQTVKLDMFVPIRDTSLLNPRLVHLNPYFRLYLPTEAVIHKPEIVIPHEARIYKMSGRATCRDGFSALITRTQAHEEIQEASQRREPHHVCDVYLVEVWEDYGDDGHTEYQLMGWRAVTESRFNQELKEAKEKNLALPVCMTRAMDD